MIRVAVADDQVLFHVLLEPEEDLELVGEAGNGAEAVALARQPLEQAEQLLEQPP